MIHLANILKPHIYIELYIDDFTVFVTSKAFLSIMKKCSFKNTNSIFEFFPLKQ